MIEIFNTPDPKLAHNTHLSNDQEILEDNPVDQRVASPNIFDRSPSYKLYFGDNAGFRIDKRPSQEEEIEEVFEAIDKKMIENDVQGVLGEGEVQLLGTIPKNRLNSLQASFSHRNKSVYSKVVSQKLSSEISQLGLDHDTRKIHSAMMSLDFYKATKQIIDAECPTIKAGL